LYNLIENVDGFPLTSERNISACDKDISLVYKYTVYCGIKSDINCPYCVIVGIENMANEDSSVNIPYVVPIRVVSWRDLQQTGQK
jgi:hypothetical protein